MLTLLHRASRQQKAGNREEELFHFTAV